MEERREDLISSWYDEYGDAIIKFILVMTKDYQLAEDLMHETFVKAFISLNSYRKEASPKTWLYRIAHNLTIDYFRKKKPNIKEYNFFTLYKDKGSSPDESLYIKENSLQLYAAIAELKDAYRKVIMLRKIQQFSTKETAEILHWSQSKVKSKLRQSLKALEKELGKEGYYFE